MALRLRGRLDMTALQAALQDLLARHEILRTAFVERDGQPHQVIVADLQLRLVNADLSHCCRNPSASPHCSTWRSTEAQNAVR